MDGFMRIIDFHTHILPMVDHGSDSIEVSEKQLQLASSAGVNTILSTSHFYPHLHTVNSFLKKRLDGYNKLKPIQERIGLDIILGAEVLLCDGLDRLDGLDKLCIGDTKTLLIELPFNNFSEGFYDTVQRITDLGINVVLAHADRYDERIINSFLDLSVKIQLNADSLCTLFKRKALFEWLRDGYVVGLGSDIHMADKKAYKHFSRARARMGEEAFAQIMEKSLAIISDN